MTRFLLIISLLFLSLQSAANEAELKTEIEQTLEEFLYAASVNDAQVHDNFWAEELVYTSSSGERFGKNRLMGGVNQGNTIEADEVSAWYSAEDIQINPVGEVVILNFTLVSTPANETQGDVNRFLNTGVMIQRDGRWQALNWNATHKAGN
ncbi:nuclear transport factor 2 family protein [Aliidiomarina minuta]|uniref:Nuclear transport factor 2 family protein n=1 Tax=Aliidiomarina minuta TaxID=880057 RepID=A0A432W3K2_9GAMM|nr:nuclear transport factor 2 family protein [Aliidiomarina minuta]RUO23933.1 nuclear transport factor 2 family protein [Aliidiomarina minuta]